MKIIAAIFAVVALLSAVLGFGMEVLPILSQLGKIAAALAMAGFVITAVAYVPDELLPSITFKADDINP